MHFSHVLVKSSGPGTYFLRHAGTKRERVRVRDRTREKEEKREIGPGTYHDALVASDDELDAVDCAELGHAVRPELEEARPALAVLVADDRVVLGGVRPQDLVDGGHDGRRVVEVGAEIWVEWGMRRRVELVAVKINFSIRRYDLLLSLSSSKPICRAHRMGLWIWSIWPSVVMLGPIPPCMHRTLRSMMAPRGIQLNISLIRFHTWLPSKLPNFSMHSRRNP